jgi:tRNA G37 N-methylase Trm5
MGNRLIAAMKAEDLEIVCDRLVLIKESLPKDTKRQILSDKLIQELKKEDYQAVFNELLMEIKADDLQYLCSSLNLTRSTSSMRKPVKDDLLRLLKAHTSNTAGRNIDSVKKEFKYQQDLRIAVSVKSPFVTSDNIKDLELVFKKFGVQSGSSIYRQEDNEFIFMVCLIG